MSSVLHNALLFLTLFFCVAGGMSGLPLAGHAPDADAAAPTNGPMLYFYPADPAAEDLDARLDGAVEVIRARLEGMGWTDAVVERGKGDVIRVRVAAGMDAKTVSALVTAPARLEFRAPDDAVIVEGKDVEDVYATMDPSTEVFAVAIQLNDEGAARFEEATARLIGQEIDIWLDDEWIAAPIVPSVITGKNFVISMDPDLSQMESWEEATHLAALIRAGALPLELRPAVR